MVEQQTQCKKKKKKRSFWYLLTFAVEMTNRLTNTTFGIASVIAKQAAAGSSAILGGNNTRKSTPTESPFFVLTVMEKIFTDTFSLKSEILFI